MKILIVGSGAREHAIARALYLSPQEPALFCCGTSINPGIASMTQDYWAGDITDVEAVLSQAEQWQIELAIIGPEAPLEKGLADLLWHSGIPTIGPKKALAQIETSKVYARALMQKYGIPGLPRFKHFTGVEGLAEFLAELGEENYVVKANGLMGGKGVKVAGDHLQSISDAIFFCQEVFAVGDSVLIEEKLIGQEFSLMCFCDGTHAIPMPAVQDHKRAYVNDKGPNTGGMGSYSDVDHSLPFLTAKEIEAAHTINAAALTALMTEMNEPYIGILYGSFIATRNGIYVIEFNARFGDPEVLNVLSILKSDFVSLCDAMVKGGLSTQKVIFANRATVCKYAVPEGYPDAPLQNKEIDITQVEDSAHLYLASINAIEGKLFALGSRAVAYVGVDDTIANAEAIAEQEISAVKGALFHRFDIGTANLINQRIQMMNRLRAEEQMD